jgi:hypothetical protein
MDTDDLERVNVWNQPKPLGQMRERNGGTLFPPPKPPITAQPTELGRMRHDSGQKEPSGIGMENLSLQDVEEP